MKRNLKKVLAATLAMTMCVPTFAFAADTSGSFQTSFDIYSPVLTVSVPTSLDIRVNPIVESGATDVSKFTVASGSIDIMNASVDVEKDAKIPVNVTVQAAIASRNEDVVTEYNSFAADEASKKKRIYLELTEAGTAATAAAKTGETLAFDSEKKLNLEQFEISTKASYASPTNKTAITKYGSVLSMNIAGPSTTDTTTGATLSTDPTKVTPTTGSFAVTGVANTNADWNANDVAVNVTYNIKASAPVTFTTPVVAGVTVTSGSDLSITVPNIGEATIAGVALHNDNEGCYGDFLWENDAYTVDYTTTPGSAIIKVDKADGGLVFISGEGYKGVNQDIVVALSDGRMVVTTVKVN